MESAAVITSSDASATSATNSASNGDVSANRQTSGSALPPPRKGANTGPRKAQAVSSAAQTADAGDGKEKSASKAPRDAVDSNGNRILSVAQTSNVKLVAGSIAHTSRESNPPTLQAIGSASTNQAVKAIAIARTYVEENGLDFLVEPARVQSGEIKNLVQLRLEKRALHDSGDIEYVDLKTASTTDSAALAGAIANNTREGRRVRITAVGAGPVFRAIDAIIKARGFLEKDAVDIRFQPSFASITTGEGKRINSIQFTIFTQQI